ncbi:lactosylceramide 4-alpha-galactosyltransferase [Diorhabda carinulata]|uniref:lactosylceramide 4-alpha-galactosyltransferase n=1 Tax=Diorhabda carinulata TaxID=1163345 RepID=UPI0025A0143B|nr:lactosylceramide 4-alpha-galactosyltransferase [Diorhabda carinulata]
MNVFILQKCFKILLCLVLTSIVVVFFFQNQYLSIKFYKFFYSKDTISCYRIQTPSLPDITEISPRKGKSIFFHETSCRSFFNDKISITSRQACAVESAAKINPNLDVYLLFTSPGLLKNEKDESDQILQALKTYKNLKMMHLDYEKYVKGTPVEELYTSGKIDNSYYAQSHASDVLRYLTLWKYGGIYLDLDVIVVKSLEDVPPNYAGIESNKNVAAGVLSFDATGEGHKLAERCVNDLKDNFNGRDWGNNGPGVITRLLKSVCNVELAKDMINKYCGGFTAYPSNVFYPVPWQKWKIYFDENSTEAVVNLAKDSIAIHVWNKHSELTRLPLSSDAPYIHFARKYCPRVIAAIDEYF